MNSQNTLIEARIEKFSYPRDEFTVSNINLNIYENDFISVIGRNGSGKSTIVKLLTGAYVNYDGFINIFGKNIKSYKQKELSRKICYIPQSGLFIYDDMSVYEFLLSGRYAHKNFTDFSITLDDKKAVSVSLKKTNSLYLQNKNLSELSGGERQKILLALSLVQLDVMYNLAGKILIIDEPLTYLDINYQYEIFSLLKNLNSEQNLTIIIITHDIPLALKYTSGTILMDNGKIIGFGKTTDIITEEMLKRHFHVDSQIIKTNGELQVNFLSNQNQKYE